MLEEVFGTLENGTLVIGTGRQAGAAPGVAASASAALLRLIAPAPTATALPSGTLDASVSAALPGAVVGGAKLKGSALVSLSNPTSQAIIGPATVTLYVSLGQSLGGATQVLQIRPRLKLKAGGHMAVRLKLVSLPSLPLGSYYLVAAVDAPDGTTSGAAGPSLTIAPAYVSVIASNPIPQAAAVKPGKKASLTLTLQSMGNVPAAGTAGVTIIASTEPSGAGGTLVATVPLKVKLKAGATGHFLLRFTVPPSLPAGQYYAAVDVNVAALKDPIASDGMAVSGLALQVI